MLTVYHGAACVIKHPLCNAGRPKLDFGQGFYVADLREQAVRWAQRQGITRDVKPQLNIYELDVERARSCYRYLRF